MTNNDLEPAERYTRQPALSFQKCYERDQNMKARNHRPKARSHTIALLSTGWGSDKSNTLEKLLHITLYFRKKKKRKMGSPSQTFRNVYFLPVTCVKFQTNTDLLLS